MSKEELQHQIRQAATSLLTDDEICTALGITPVQLQKHYGIVEQARVNLKQRLNAKRIADAANARGNGADELLAGIPRSRPKVSSRGGARPGAGRKPGTTNKISAQSLLASIQTYTGEPFEDLLAQGYADSIQNRDQITRIQYEKMFLGKVVAERVELDVNENTDALQAKQSAFAEAIRQITGIAPKD